MEGVTWISGYLKCKRNQIEWYTNLTLILFESDLTRGVRLVSDADFFVTLQVKRGFQTMKKK